MNVWQWLTKKLPLKDGRGIMTQIGFRFIWCTGPHFLVTSILSVSGSNKMYAPWPALFFVTIPFMGGITDWYQIKHRTSVPKTIP